MLKLKLKNGEKLQVGEDVFIELKSNIGADLWIDAPREISIRRIPKRPDQTKTVKGNKYILVNNKEI